MAGIPQGAVIPVPWGMLFAAFSFDSDLSNTEASGMHECIPYKKQPAYSNSKTSDASVGNGFICSEKWVLHHGWFNGNSHAILCLSVYCESLLNNGKIQTFLATFICGGAKVYGMGISSEKEGFI